jgi:hypothetical protein
MSTLVQQVNDADASDSQVQLLGVFLAAGAAPAKPRDFVRAPFEIAAAVRVAASLFHDALAAGHDERARELWLMVGTRWLRLSRRASFRRWLHGAAVGAGISDPDDAANHVADRELLDLLGHVHGALSTEPDVSTEDKRFHTERMSSLTDTARSEDLRALLWEQRLEIVRQNVVKASEADPVPGRVLASYTTLIQDQPDERVAWQVADEAAAAAQVALQCIAADGTPSLARDYAAAAAELIKAAPNHYSLRRVWSQLLMLQGVHAMRVLGEYDSGGMAVARAAAIDPLNHESDLLLQHGRATLRSFGPKLRAAESNLSFRGIELLLEYETDMKHAFAFAGSTEYRRLRNATHVAAGWELAARLGLDASSAAARAATDALIAALGSADGELAWDSLREDLIAAHPVLAQIDWDALEAAVEQVDGITAILLTEALPPRPARAELRALAGFAAVREQLMNRPAVRERRAAAGRSRAALYHWATSREGGLAKAMAIAGIVLLISATTTYHARRADADQRESAYARFEHAVASNDTATALGAAQMFFDATQDAMLDGRSQPLADQYASLLLGELRRAATAHRTDQLTQLTSQVRALRTWLSANPRQVHHNAKAAGAASKEAS